MRFTILVDRDKCVGCYSCVVACQLEHSLPPHPARPPVGDAKGPELIRVCQVGPQSSDGEVRQYFQPVLCRHCPDAPCIEACPSFAIRKDAKTGVTLVNEDECTGCMSCLPVCPYAAPHFYDDKLVLCDMCIHRLGEVGREGRRTACEAACPGRAIRVGTLD